MSTKTFESKNLDFFFFVGRPEPAPPLEAAGLAWLLTIVLIRHLDLA
jgi:hypothetical protein